MKYLVIPVVLILCSIQLTFAQNFEFTADDIDIKYEKFVLPNGLKLLIHEDHKAPIVAVNVWYHVGSKNEKPGKSPEDAAALKSWLSTASTSQRLRSDP